MNTITAKALCTLVFLCVAAVGQQVPVQQMTDATVVQMVQAKVSSDLIILAISKCEPHFQLDPGNTQYMLQLGVTDEIFKAMALKQVGKPIPGYTQESPITQTSTLTTASQLGYVQQTPPAPRHPVVNPKTQYDASFGTIDLSVGGGVFIDKDLVPAAHPAVLTTTTIALHKYVAAYGEFGYTHLASGSGDIYGYNVSANAYLLDYGAGGKFTIPTGTRVVPYGTFGFGRSHLRGSASVSDYGSVSAGEAFWNLNLGGGVNVFATRNIGINFDFRAYRPSENGYSNWYERAAFGVFFQFNNKAF
jgi:hypothetical protein